MSVPQYLRKYSLLVGDAQEAIDVSELRFKFAIRRGDLQTPNTCDIRVYNLADSTMQKVEKEFTRIVLMAGYEGNYGVIFDGTVKQVRRGRESSTDTYLDITAADGDSAYNFAVCAFSLKAGNNAPVHAFAGIARAMKEQGVEQGYIPELQGNNLPRGKVVFGMARDAMRNLAENMRCSWSIQDGKLEMIQLTAYKPGDIPVLTQDTGMIGMPEQTQNGIKLKTLLNPNLKIGQAVKIDNASIQKYRYSLNAMQSAQNYLTQQTIHLNNDGLYYIMQAEHTGDTRGNEWYTDLICLAIDATIANSSIAKQGDVGPVGPVKEFG